MSSNPSSNLNIVGQYSNGKTSRAIEVSLYLTANDHIGLHGIDEQPVAFDAVSISSRIGNTPRFVEFPNGAHFETLDNDGIDLIINQATAWHPLNFARNLPHKIESSKRWVFATLIVMIFFGWSFVQFGAPYFSKQIAFMLNDEQAQMLGKGALDSLDEHLMEASELTETRQADLQREFSALSKTLNINNLRIVFRKSRILGANALALPDGTIVFTDALINLAANNREIVPVMLHEIGHLKNRHSLRRVIQSFSLAAFIAVITGDVSTSSSIIAGLPVVLVESGYSRGMETEADTFALQYMQNNDIDPASFSRMMEKLQVSRGDNFVQCMAQKKNIQECLRKAIDALNDDATQQKKESGFGRYFASHPLSRERIERFRNAKKISGSD